MFRGECNLSNGEEAMIVKTLYGEFDFVRFKRLLYRYYEALSNEQSEFEFDNQIYVTSGAYMLLTELKEKLLQ